MNKRTFINPKTKFCKRQFIAICFKNTFNTCGLVWLATYYCRLLAIAEIIGGMFLAKTRESWGNIAKITVHSCNSFQAQNSVATK